MESVINRTTAYKEPLVLATIITIITVIALGIILAMGRSNVHFSQSVLCKTMIALGSIALPIGLAATTYLAYQFYKTYKAEQRASHSPDSPPPSPGGLRIGVESNPVVPAKVLPEDAQKKDPVAPPLQGRKNNAKALSVLVVRAEEAAQKAPDRGRSAAAASEEEGESSIADLAQYYPEALRSGIYEGHKFISLLQKHLFSLLKAIPPQTDVTLNEKLDRLNNLLEGLKRQAIINFCAEKKEAAKRHLNDPWRKKQVETATMACQAASSLQKKAVNELEQNWQRLPPEKQQMIHKAYTLLKIEQKYQQDRLENAQKAYNNPNNKEAAVASSIEVSAGKLAVTNAALAQNQYFQLLKAIQRLEELPAFSGKSSLENFENDIIKIIMSKFPKEAKHPLNLLRTDLSPEMQLLLKSPTLLLAMIENINYLTDVKKLNSIIEQLSDPIGFEKKQLKEKLTTASEAEKQEIKRRLESIEQEKSRQFAQASEIEVEYKTKKKRLKERFTTQNTNKESQQQQLKDLKNQKEQALQKLPHCNRSFAKKHISSMGNFLASSPRLLSFTLGSSSIKNIVLKQLAIKDKIRAVHNDLQASLPYEHLFKKLYIGKEQWFDREIQEIMTCIEEIIVTYIDIIFSKEGFGKKGAPKKLLENLATGLTKLSQGLAACNETEAPLTTDRLTKTLNDSLGLFITELTERQRAVLPSLEE